MGEPISSPPLAADQEAGAEAPIDQAHLARMTLGDERLKAEVLALFDRQASILLARMRQAPASTVGAFAHTLKGSARGIGAWRVAAAAEAVERDAAKQGAADMADTLDRLAAAVAQVRAATQDVLTGR